MAWRADALRDHGPPRGETASAPTARPTMTASAARATAVPSRRPHRADSLTEKGERGESGTLKARPDGVRRERVAPSAPAIRKPANCEAAAREGAVAHVQPLAPFMEVWADDAHE